MVWLKHFGESYSAQIFQAFPCAFKCVCCYALRYTCNGINGVKGNLHVQHGFVWDISVKVVQLLKGARQRMFCAFLSSLPAFTCFCCDALNSWSSVILQTTGLHREELNPKPVACVSIFPQTATYKFWPKGISWVAEKDAGIFWVLHFSSVLINNNIFKKK